MSPTESIRTRLVQMQVRPGRPTENLASMQRAIKDARADRIRLLVFPEMALPGYLIGDEWEHLAFLRECEACGKELEADSRGMTVIFGSVGLDWKRRNEDGRVRKYNALYVAHDGAFIGPSGGPYPFAIKTLLPNYREFDDSRHFYDLRKLAMEENVSPERLITPVRVGRLSLGCLLCEDAWDTDYPLAPLDILARFGVDCFINISCSPFTLNKDNKRQRVYSHHAARLQRPLLYVNNTGIQNNGKTVFTFDGATCAYDTQGHIRSGPPAFEEGALTMDLPVGSSATFGVPLTAKEDGIADLYAAVRYGTREFMSLCSVQRVVVGISGGIDSAVVAAIYRQLVGADDLLLVNMPSRYNSPTTRGLAKTLAANLDALYAEVPIEASVELTASQIRGLRVQNADGSSAHTLELTGLMMENVQARDRSSRILAALAAAFGGVFTCNANKSEATVGYSTLYGDLCGYLANIADLWKMEVYDMARYLNREVYGREVIPQGILDVTPSAELSPAQNVDEGKGDPILYAYHDRLFQNWVESWDRSTPEDILEWYIAGTLEARLGYAGRIANLFPTATTFVADLERWWNQYQGMGLAKRIQAPPVLAVKRRAFGFDHRESQMGPHYTRHYQELKAGLLSDGQPKP